MKALSAVTKILAAVLLLTSASAFAASTPPAAVVFPEWINFSLSVPTFFSKVYAHSLAESVYVRSSGTGFLSPIQYLTRKMPANHNLEDPTVGKEILASLGVDPSAPGVMRMSKGFFRAGEHAKLNGYFEEYYSSANDGKDTYVTCLAFIESDEKVMKVLYNQVSRASLSTCAHELVSLSRSSSFAK